MQRCKVLEFTAKAIYGLPKDLVRDNSGCAVHEIEYEHRDPSYRGRLFAIGQQVKVEFNDNYPRTATLQGMHSDLRAPLVGEFAHDIDCKNSEVRLVFAVWLASLIKRSSYLLYSAVAKIARNGYFA